MKKVMLIVAVITVVGCVAKTVPQKHAWYFSQHTSGTLNGNFQTQRNEVYRMNLPEFEKAYQQGVADRDKGKNSEYANAYASSIRKEAMTQHKVQNTFQNNPGDQWQDTAEPKDATLWYGELAAAYLDGYNGIK
jgi:hypothetical protein